MLDPPFETPAPSRVFNVGRITFQDGQCFHQRREDNGGDKTGRKNLMGANDLVVLEVQVRQVDRDFSSLRSTSIGKSPGSSCSRICMIELIDRSVSKLMSASNVNPSETAKMSPALTLNVASP